MTALPPAPGRAGLGARVKRLLAEHVHHHDDSHLRSLAEVHRSVDVAHDTVGGRPWWRRMLGFAGPGFMVAVGYMDPGNWGTDLAGGSKFGYALLWVVLVSSLMAMFLQVLCARLGIVTGKDLAQCCRDYYSRPVAIALWLICEVAIIACDLAEVIGSAVALNLLLGLPLAWGVVITGADVLLLMLLMTFGFRKLEAVVLVLVATISGCLLYTMFLAKPDWAQVGAGLVTPSLPGSEALLIALGILGATVMPHNLYLHSSIVQTRQHGLDNAGKAGAIRYNTADTIVALGAAFFVNAALLILAAAVFHRDGRVVEELEEAHALLKPALGGAAATAFAVALLASGQSSTITGTLAGQIVMEGFLRIRLKPWLRRLITRSLAIIPAIISIVASGGKNTVQLLVISQVVLSMQLPFAIFPLLVITSSRARMGEFANPAWVKVIGFPIGIVISGLNAYLLWQNIGTGWSVAVFAAILAFWAWVRLVYTPASPPRAA